MVEMAGEDDAVSSLQFTSQQFNPVRALSSHQLLDVSSGARIFNNLKEYTDSLKDSASFRSLNWFPSELGIVPSSRPFEGPACLGHRGSGHLLKGDDSEGDTVNRRNLKRKAQSPLGFPDPRNEELPSAASVTDADLLSKLKKLSNHNTADQRNAASNHEARRSDDRSEKLKSLMTSDIASSEGKGKQKRVRPNVMQRMEECQQGPMSILYNCMTKGIKLKVWTRRYKGLRGVCVGYLIAFDKHMNLAMIDVDEIYTLEVRTLPLEEQAEIKKQKRTIKRNRNRLNKINRAVRDIEDKDAGQSISESDGSNVPAIELDAAEDLKTPRMIKKGEISKEVKDKRNEASKNVYGNELYLENDNADVVSDHFSSQKEQSSTRSSDGEKMYKGSEARRDSGHRKETKLKKDSKWDHNDVVKVPVSETASEIDRMSRSHKSRSKSASRCYNNESEDSEVMDTSQESRRRSKSHKSSKKGSENSRERHKKKNHTSKKHRRSSEGKRHSESKVSLQANDTLLIAKTVSEDPLGLMKESNKKEQLKDNASSKGDQEPSCQHSEKLNQTKGSFASCTSREEDTEKKAKRRIKHRASERISGMNDGAIEMKLVQEMPRDVDEKRTLDTVLKGIITPSKNGSDFNVSESSDEQIAKKVDSVTGSDDGDYSDKAFKGLHDFAKGFNSTGKDKERDKDVKYKARDKDRKGQVFQQDKSSKRTGESPVLSSELEGGGFSQQTIPHELKEEVLSSNVIRATEYSKSGQTDDRVRFTYQLGTDKKILESKNRSSKENMRCNFMLFSGQKSRKSKIKPEQLLSVPMKAVKEQLKPNRRCTFSLFSNLKMRQLLDGTDPDKIPQLLIKSRPEDLLKRTEKIPIILHSDQKGPSMEASVEMKSKEIGKCIQNLDTDGLCQASVRKKQFSDSCDTEIGSRGVGQPLINSAKNDAEYTTESIPVTLIYEPQSASDDSESDSSDKDDHEDHDSDEGDDTQTHVDQRLIGRDDERPVCVSLEDSYNRDCDNDFNDGDDGRPNSPFSSHNNDNRESDHVFSGRDDTASQVKFGPGDTVDAKPGNRVWDDNDKKTESDHDSNEDDNHVVSSKISDNRGNGQSGHDLSDNTKHLRDSNDTDDKRLDDYFSNERFRNQEIDHESDGGDKRPHSALSNSSDNRDSGHDFSDNTKQLLHGSNDTDDERLDDYFLNEKVENRKSDFDSSSSDTTRQYEPVFDENGNNRDNDHDSNCSDEAGPEHFISTVSINKREIPNDPNNIEDNGSGNHISNVIDNRRGSDLDSKDRDKRPAKCVSIVDSGEKESDSDCDDDNWNHNADADLAIVSDQIEMAIKGNANDPLHLPLPLEFTGNEVVKHSIAQTSVSSASVHLNKQSPRTTVEISIGKTMAMDVFESTPVREMNYELTKLELGDSKGYQEMDASQFSSSSDPQLNLNDPRVRKMMKRQKSCSENLDAVKVTQRRETNDNEGTPYTLNTVATESHIDVENRTLKLYDSKRSEMSEEALIESHMKSEVAGRPKDPRMRRPSIREQRKLLSDHETKDKVKEEFIDFKGRDAKGNLVTDAAFATEQKATKADIVSVTKSKVSDPRLRDPRLKRYSSHGERRSFDANNVISRSKSTENMEIFENEMCNVKSESLSDENIECGGNLSTERTSTDKSCGVRILDDILSKLTATKQSKIGQSGIASSTPVEGFTDTAYVERGQDASLLPQVHSSTRSENDNSEEHDQCADVSDERDAGKVGDSQNVTGEGTTQHVAMQSSLEGNLDRADEAAESLHAGTSFDSAERKDSCLTSSADYFCGNKEGDNIKGHYNHEMQNDTKNGNETAQYQNYDESNCITMEVETLVWEPQPSITIYRNESADKGTQRRKFDLPTVSANFDPLRPIPGHVLRRRHVNQLFIRGDNIALVAYDKVE